MKKQSRSHGLTSAKKDLKDKTDYKKLDAMADSDIDYSDSPEMDDIFLSKGKVVDLGPKKAISLRVDEDVLDWFKHQEGRYQHLIGKVLRKYMEAHKSS